MCCLLIQNHLLKLMWYHQGSYERIMNKCVDCVKDNAICCLSKKKSVTIKYPITDRRLQWCHCGEGWQRGSEAYDKKMYKFLESSAQFFSLGWELVQKLGEGRTLAHGGLVLIDAVGLFPSISLESTWDLEKFREKPGSNTRTWSLFLSLMNRREIGGLNSSNYHWVQVSSFS